jgi:hypothetical protein
MTVSWEVRRATSESALKRFAPGRKDSMASVKEDLPQAAPPVIPMTGMRREDWS